MTRSTGICGLTREGSPPRAATASRIAARSTTHGTPVKSCRRILAGEKAISRPEPDPAATAAMSSSVTLMPSSLRSRFSRRIFSEKGSRSTPKSDGNRPSRLIEYRLPPTSSSPSVPNELRPIDTVLSRRSTSDATGAAELLARRRLGHIAYPDGVWVNAVTKATQEFDERVGVGSIKDVGDDRNDFLFVTGESLGGPFPAERGEERVRASPVRRARAAIDEARLDEPVHGPRQSPRREPGLRGEGGHPQLFAG